MFGFKFTPNEGALFLALRWDHELEESSVEEGFITKRVDVVIGPFVRSFYIRLNMKEASKA